MNKENKNIDVFVKNKLGDLKVEAPMDAWNNISGQINTPSKGIVFYWKYIAASVALLFAFGTGYFISFKHFNRKMADVSKEKVIYNDTVKSTSGKTIIIPIKHHNAIAYNKKDRLIVSKNNATAHTTKVIEKSVNKDRNTYIELLAMKSSTLQSSMNTKILKPVEKNKERKYSPKELLKLQNEAFEKENTLAKNTNKKKIWTIGAQLAPNYSYREMKNNTTELPSDYYNSVEKALLTFSGGVNVNFKVNKRFSFQSGINYAQFGQSSSLLYAEANPVTGSAYAVATSAGIIRPQPASIGQISNGYRYVDKLGNIINTNAALIQNFNYIEIPFNSKFKLIDSKFDLNLLGGISTNILFSNKVFFKENNVKSYIGETENLNKIRYSTNFGLGMDYAISSKVNINLEPVFKYSLVPINKNPEINNYPITFGLYSGVSIKF